MKIIESEKKHSILKRQYNIVRSLCLKNKFIHTGSSVNYKYKHLIVSTSILKILKIKQS